MSRMVSPFENAFGMTGDTLPGARLWFYASGTSMPLNTYSDAERTVANTNPAVADAAGRFGPIFLEDTAYKVRLTDADGATVWTADPVVGFISAAAEGSITADAFTGDGLTTAYTLSRALSAGGGAVVVAVDGVVQAPATYAVSGVTLTFSEAPPAGSVIDIRVLGKLVAVPLSFQVGDTTAGFLTWTHDGDGATVSFAIPGAVLSLADGYRVDINGLSQEPTASFTVDSTAGTLTFSEAPPDGSRIVVTCLGYPRPITGQTELSVSGAISAGLNTGTGGLVVGGASSAAGGYGGRFRSDGHANWTILGSTVPYNPTELNIYGGSGQGIAQSQNGTNQLVLTSGGSFQSAWVGDWIYWNGTKYTVNTWTDATHITVRNTDGSGVTFGSTASATYHYSLTTGTGTCNVSGSTVTRVSGQPFVSLIGDGGYTFSINGTVRAVASWTSGDVMTLSAPPGDAAGATYRYYMDINAQVATVRVQKMWGSSEENLTLAARATGEYEIRAGIAGSGSYYPIRVKNGGLTNCEFFTNGDTSLGGARGGEQLRVSYQASTVNYAEIKGGVAGFRASVRARGTDTDVGLNLDTQGAGDFLFTRGGFATTVGRIQGDSTWNIGGLSGAEGLRVSPVASQVNRVEVTGSATGNAPTVRGRGGDTNVGLALDTQGTGAITFTRGNFGTVTGQIAGDSTWYVGGLSGADALRVLPTASQVNRVEVSGSAAGGSTTLRTRGSDTNVNLNIDTRGSGAVSFTSGSFGGTNFKVYHGASAVNFVTVTGAASGSAALIAADGGDANVNLKLAPRGTGRVQFGTLTASGDAAVSGYIEILDSGGTVRKLAVIS